MKRNLIAIAAVVLALGTNVVLAQDQFMDSYWKDLNTAHSNLTPTIGAESRADFSFVDPTPAQ